VSLQQRFAEAALIVAGDLSQDLGGKHYYGTNACRALLNTELVRASLVCLSTTDRFDAGLSQHPPIDHVCAGPGQRRRFTTGVHGWNNVVDDARLSDHGGRPGDVPGKWEVPALIPPNDGSRHRRGCSGHPTRGSPHLSRSA
jgi:hypothetical protein